MNIEQECIDGVEVFHLVGDLDGDSAEIIRDTVLSAIAPETRIVLDMGKSKSVTGVGLRLLLALAKHSAMEGTRAYLAALPADIADLMDITGFGDSMKSFPDVEAALAFVNGVDSHDRTA